MSDADGRIKELQGHLQRLQAQQSELSRFDALLVVSARVAQNMQRMLFGSELSTPVVPSCVQFPMPNACLGLPWAA